MYVITHYFSIPLNEEIITLLLTVHEIQRNLTYQLEYSLQKAYGVQELSASSARSMFDSIKVNTQHFVQYLAQKYVLYSPDRIPLLCSVINQDNTQYTQCNNEYDVYEE